MVSLLLELIKGCKQLCGGVGLLSFSSFGRSFGRSRFHPSLAFSHTDVVIPYEIFSYLLVKMTDEALFTFYQGADRLVKEKCA